LKNNPHVFASLLSIFVEIKNKHNTLNASSASDLYIRMQNKILKDDKAVCYLVEVIAQDSDNKPWKLTINRGGRREAYAHERIRRISMEEAQQKIVSTIRRLEDGGEIVIARSGEDELVV